MIDQHPVNEPITAGSLAAREQPSRQEPMAGPSPRYEVTSLTEALGYLIEECGEVQAAAGKTVRWGPDCYNPELPPEEREINRDWLLREVDDLEEAIKRIRAFLR